MLKLVIILYLLTVALTIPAQQNENVYYCYNEQKYKSPESDYSSITALASKDSIQKQYNQSPGFPVRSKSYTSGSLCFKQSSFDLNRSVYNYYHNSSVKTYDFLQEYRADFARNMFWKRSFGKWQLVMNGAKGFCDLFSTEYMEKQFSFVSPELYRKYTVAYSTGLKWGTFGAGVNLRTFDFRIFLVSCKL